MILYLDLEGVFLIFGFINIDRWLDKLKGGRLYGVEKNLGKLVKIWFRVLLFLVGNEIVGLRWKVLIVDWIIGRSDLLKLLVKIMV